MAKNFLEFNLNGQYIRAECERDFTEEEVQEFAKMLVEWNKNMVWRVIKGYRGKKGCDVIISNLLNI